MASRIYSQLALVYCSRALRLCRAARGLVAEGKHKEAAEICIYVSTLCIKNPNTTCHKESELCRASAEARLRGDLKTAEELCLMARRICPKNFEIRGL